MPEYRIVAKIDPTGVVAGRQKVEQELGRLDNAAASTTGSIEKMTAAQFRAAGGADGLAKSTKAATTSAGGLDRALDRVLAAVDAEALALKRLNQLLNDAKRLHDAGKISTEQYARVQKLAADGIDQTGKVAGRTRQGFTQLSFQLGDISQQYALGTKASTIFAQQSGQVVQALQLLTTSGKGVLGFLGGPWGIAIATATVVLLPLISGLLKSGNALDDEVEKLKKDAIETANTDRAKKIFETTLDGVTDAIRRNTDALKQMEDQDKSAARRTLESSFVQQERLKGIRAETEANLRLAESRLSSAEGGLMMEGSPTARTAAASRFSEARARVAKLRDDLVKADSDIVQNEKNLLEARSRFVVEVATQLSDPIQKIHSDYDRLVDQARKRAIAEGLVGDALDREIVRRTTILRITEAQKVKEQEAADRAKSSSSGLSGRQVSFAEAEAIARKAGLAVGSGYRSTQRQAELYNDPRVNRPGNPVAKPGTSAHEGVKGKWALDINFAPGLTPQKLRKVYGDEGVSLSTVLKEKGHYHIEGSRSQAAAEESAAARAAKQAATLADQKSDFIEGIVNQSAARGLPDDRATQLRSKIDTTLAEYRRRFNEAASPEQTKRITGALTDADAREQAEHFRKAYVEPLDKLAASLGRTGLEREIYNKVLDETARKGSALSPEELAQIDRSVRYGDVLKRQGAILESIHQPIEDYTQQLAALNGLLAKGEISQANFNARVSALGDTARTAISGMPGADPTTGKSYSDIAAVADEDARFALELATFESQKQQILNLGISYDALIEAAHRRHVQNLNNIDLARKQLAIGSAMSISESLLSIAEMSAGKQSAIYKAMFLVSKAFAIADAIVKIQQGIANAISLPWPANLAAVASVAAAAASIISSIQAVQLNLADGGLVRGPGGPRDDRVNANLSAGEYVVNAAAVARPGNRALLDAINGGNMTARTRQARNDNPAGATSPGGDTISLTFGDVVVQTGAGVTAEDGQSIGRDVKQALSDLVDERIATLGRPGGRLTRQRQSVLA